MLRAILFVLACATTGTPHAEIITEWNLDGNAGNESFVAAINNAQGVAGMDLERGGDLSAIATVDTFNSGNWHNSEAGDYLSFGFTVAAGYSVALSDLEIALRASNSGPGFLSLRYSGDNFSTDLETFTQNGSSVNRQPVDLSTLSGLTGAVEFRIMPTHNASAGDANAAIGSRGTLRIHEPTGHNVLFNGTVSTILAVPEPQTYAMFLLGLLMLIFPTQKKQLCTNKK